ncbi:hypothetical protein IPJ63_00985 [Candidatus Nomurabacteria bacterium]|nr:MAG: hypothetical protein IPJ63_00985 [Candidatus Nomurabacteria bacterium]
MKHIINFIFGTIGGIIITLLIVGVTALFDDQMKKVPWEAVLFEGIIMGILFAISRYFSDKDDKKNDPHVF